MLVVVDYYSRYYEYSILQSTTTEKVLDSLDDMFSRQGWPVTIKSDNGPQFRSDEFGDYCTHYAIQHLRVTAKWAQANGGVERQNAYMSTLRHSYGVSVILASLKTSIPETKISVI